MKTEKLGLYKTRATLKGTTKNIIQYRNSCLKCDKKFTGTCMDIDDYRTKRICPGCKIKDAKKLIENDTY